MTHVSPVNAVLDREERYLLEHFDADCGIMPGDVEGSFHRIREAFSIRAQQMREPDAWEWRACIGGKWGAWLYLDAPVEIFRERNKFNLDNGTYILRPLYAFTSPESQS